MAGCCAPGPPPGLRPDSPLPREVQLETPLEARGRSHEVAVRSGRLWIRALQPESEWTLAPSDGLPRAGCFGFEPPRALVAVSADGDNLVVVGETGRVFYAKLSSYDAGRGFDWVDEFGLLWKDEVVLPERQRAFAISHRGADAGYYEDIDGNRFPMSFGVSTLYALDASGQRIRYADPWLEPDWSHLFFTPLRGRFLAVNLAASASTLFVIDASGELWTRLADYDTSGENPLPGWYTYERGLRPGRNVRTLPGWDWVRQPRPPAEVTREITILQTGQGNDARELRVRGRDERGRAGFWTKPIAAPTWSFVAVPGWQVRDDELLRPLPGAERLGPVLDVDYVGQVGVTHPYVARVLGFNPHNSPARVVVEVNEHRFEARLHFRRVRPESDGALATKLGLLELSEDTWRHEDPWMRKLVREVTGGARRIKVGVRVSPEGRELSLSESTWLFPGQRVSLRRAP